MKVMIFTEGTILMHALAKGVNREERVKQSQAAGIQREERNIAFESNTLPAKVTPGSVYDQKNYIPVDNAVKKINQWKQQGATIYYLSSRRIKPEIEAIKSVLNRYNFPDSDNVYFRQQGEDYKGVAEKLMPDILIEDDCESIGGEPEMTYPHINPQKKKLIKSIVVKEFSGIDNLPDTLEDLKNY